MPTHIYIHQYVYKHIDILTRLLTIWDAITFSNYKISYFVASTLEALKLQIKLFFLISSSLGTLTLGQPVLALALLIILRKRL